MGILKSDLGGEPDCETYDDLETKPFPCACRLIQSVGQAAANSAERAAHEPENRHDTNFNKGETLRNSRKCKWYDKCQHANTRADGVRVVDALEVEWQVVEDDEVGA